MTRAPLTTLRAGAERRGQPKRISPMVVDAANWPSTRQVQLAAAQARREGNHERERLFMRIVDRRLARGRARLAASREAS